jgi:hypothetical protein
MEGFKDRVEREWALGAVEEQRPFTILDDLRFASLDDSCGARVARFSIASFSTCNGTEMDYLHFS